MRRRACYSKAMQMSRFSILSAELYAYLNPEIFSGEIDTENIDKKKIRRYSETIHILNEAFAKVKKYENYFENFYPSSDKITNSEALQHHIHSYLEDLYLLSEAIKKLIGDLKNDLQKVAQNKVEVLESLDKCKSNMSPMFARARSERKTHRHALGRSLDFNLVKSSSLQNLIANNSPFLEYLKEGAKEYLEKEANKSFTESKEEWCNLSRENTSLISEQMERLFLSMEQLLYQFLGIEPIIMNQVREQLPNYKPIGETV